MASHPRALSELERSLIVQGLVMVKAHTLRCEQDQRAASTLGHVNKLLKACSEGATLELTGPYAARPNDTKEDEQ